MKNDWDSLFYNEKNHQLYLHQEELLKTLLTHRAISQVQCNKSLSDLTEKMGFINKILCQETNNYSRFSKLDNETPMFILFFSCDLLKHSVDFGIISGKRFGTGNNHLFCTNLRKINLVTGIIRKVFNE